METPLFQNVRGFNYSDFDRMKTMIANHEKEKRQMQERFDRKLEEAKEETELQVRRKMVMELQARQANGESESSQVVAMVEGMKRNYEMMMKSLAEAQRAKEEEFEGATLRLKKQINDLEEENLRLSMRVAALTSACEVWA